MGQGVAVHRSRLKHDHALPKVSSQGPADVLPIRAAPGGKLLENGGPVPGVRSIALTFMILATGCGHGKVLTDPQPSRPEWPCGGDVDVPGRDIGPCRP